MEKQNAAALNAMIRRVTEEGQNTLTVTGDWKIEETVLLPSEFTLVLRDCTLTMEPGTFCNMFRNLHAGTGIRDHHISIIGEGEAVLSGGEYNGLHERVERTPDTPPMTVQNTILLANVEGFLIRGLHIERQRWWAVNCYACANGEIRDLSFLADDRRLLPDGSLTRGLRLSEFGNTYIKNADGIDLRMGCHDIVIDGVSGFTEDDGVALTLLNGEGERDFVPFGHTHDIYNITVTNVTVTAFCTAVRLLSQGDGSMHHVTVSGVTDICDGTHCDATIGGVRVGDTHLYGSEPMTGEKMRQITVEDVTSNGGYAVSLAGMMQDVTVRRIHPVGENTVAVTGDRQGERIIIE